jgi:hypothetical protein
LACVFSSSRFVKRILAALISLTLVILVVSLATRRLTTPFSRTPKAAISASVPTRPPTPLPPLETSDMARDLNSPATDIRADLRLLSNILQNFRTNFPHDGNPVGNNAEITAVLAGRNKLRIAFIPASHPAINPAGELCDRWGTPFFFHAESGKQMEIRSAGPDRKMWDDDDVVISR